MYSSNQTDVKFAYYSKSKEVFNTLIYYSEVSSTLSEFLNKIKPHNGVIIDYEAAKLTTDLTLHKKKDYYYFNQTASFGGLSNLLLGNKVNQILDSVYPGVTFVYLDESARINSDSKGIIFDTRLKICYNLYNRYNIKTEYYVSNDDVRETMKYKGIKLDEFFDINEPEDREELRKLLETPSSYVDLIYYDYEYKDEMYNDQIISFLH